MTPRLTTWHEVQVGMYVQDSQGVTWRVEDQRDGKILLQGRSEDRRVIDRPVDTTGVTVLEPTDDEALSLVENMLGGTVVAQRLAEIQPWTCPPLRHRLQEIHNHMFLMHGVWTASGPNSKSVEKLLAAHKDDHLTLPHVSHAWVEHIHKEIT